MAYSKNIAVKFLRWLGVVPGAILAMLLSPFPLHLILYQTLTGSGIVTPYPETPERVLMPLAATLAFVWAGSRIAPSRKVETAVALLGAALLCIGAALALGFSGATIGGIEFFVVLGGLPAAAGILGAFIGLYVVHRESIRDAEAGDSAELVANT